MDDDKYNYEQEFLAKVKQTTPPVKTASVNHAANTKNKAPIIVSIVLACIVFIETIALVPLLIAYFNTQNDGPDVGYSDSTESISEEGDYIFDDTYTIVAFDLTCTDDDGNTFVFDKTNTYRRTGSQSNYTESGTYSIVKGGAVVLNNPTQESEKIVYYDGYYIMEGLTFYSCEEKPSQSS